MITSQKNWNSPEFPKKTEILSYFYFTYAILFHCYLLSLNNMSKKQNPAYRMPQAILEKQKFLLRFGHCLHHLCSITCGVPQGQVLTPLLIQKTLPQPPPESYAANFKFKFNLIYYNPAKKKKIAALRPASVERSCAHFSSFVEVNAKELECCFINQKAEPVCGNPFQQEV